MAPTVETLQADLIILRQEVNQLKANLNVQSTEQKYNVQQVALLLGLTPSGVNFHIRKGNIVATGKRCKKITESELTRYIKSITKTEVKSFEAQKQT